MLHAAGRLGSNFIVSISLCHDLHAGDDLHPVLQKKAHVGGGERAARVRPADDGLDLCDPVSGCKTIEHGPGKTSEPLVDKSKVG